LVVLVSRKVKDMLRPDRQGERTGVH
jgi:hypothetical protein